MFTAVLAITTMSFVQASEPPDLDSCFRKLGWEPPLRHVTVSADRKWAVVDPSPKQGTGRTLPLARFELVDLITCAVVLEFRAVRFHYPGRFSPDSQEYQLYNPKILVNDRPFNLGRVFRLSDRSWIERSFPE